MAASSFSWSRCGLVFLCTLLLLTEFSMAGKEGTVKVEDCPKACAVRCSATSHKKPCNFYCNKCCRKCQCVPSGTYGNKEECQCYNIWKTKEGKPKCP